MITVHRFFTTFVKCRGMSKRCRNLLSKWWCSYNKWRETVVKHRSTNWHGWKSLYDTRTYNKKNKNMNTWLVMQFVEKAGETRTECGNVVYRLHAYCYIRNASQNVQRLQNVCVWEKTMKLLFQCSKNNKYFTRTRCACFQLLSSIISPRNRDIQFRLFLITSVATVHQRL